MLTIVALFTVDHRWPLVNEGWRMLFESNAPLRLYNPTLFPWAALIAAAAVAVLAGMVMLNSWRVFITSAAKLEQANTNRIRNNGQLVHYVSELLRIRTLARQFNDHAEVAAVLLHDPFGASHRPEEAHAVQLDWPRQTASPPGLLVAMAAPAAAVTAEEQRRLKQVFRANWLNEVLHEARRAWQTAYEARIVSGFEWPEGDTSPRGTVRHRSRQTGEPVLGPRSDWIEFAANGGLQQAAVDWLERRMQETTRGVPSSYADSLTGLRPLTEHVGWWASAAECFASAVDTHDFEWAGVLSDTAATPPTQCVSNDITLSDACTDEDLIVLYKWELVATAAVQPRHLEQLGSPPAAEHHFTEDEI